MILATFKGCEVDAGVNWIVDKNTITITCRPSRGPWNKKLIHSHLEKLLH